MLRANLASLKPRRHFLARWFLVAAIGTALAFITRAVAAQHYQPPTLIRGLSDEKF